MDGIYLVVSAAITGMAAIITTIITQSATTKRETRTSSQRKPRDESEAIISSEEMACHQMGSRLARVRRWFGLGSIWLSMVQLSLVQFGSDRSVALSAADAAAIVQSFIVFFMGWWQLTR